MPHTTLPGTQAHTPPTATPANPHEPDRAHPRFNTRVNHAPRAGVLAAATSAALLICGATALGQNTRILQVYGNSLTSYRAGSPTPIQDIHPGAAAQHRGVQIDGTPRAGSPQGWSVAGNSVAGGVGTPRLGDIRLDVGLFAPTEVDIALPAPGFSWVVGRTFNNQQQGDSDGVQGFNWMQMSQPEIVRAEGATDAEDLVYLVYGADRFIEFQRTGGSDNTYKAKNGAAGVIVVAQNGSGEPETYTYTDQRGMRVIFLGFDGDAAPAMGQLWKVVDPAGNEAYIGAPTLSSSTATTGYSSGRTTTAYDSADRRYTYTYTTIDSVVRLTRVTAETKTGGTWASPTGVSTVAQVEYDYYASTDSSDVRAGGDNGNLKLVTVTTPLTDSGQSLARKTHYRYWKGSFNATTNPGHPNSIKFVFDPEGYRRADWADATLNDSPLTLDLSGANKQYTAAYLEYDSARRVVKAYFNGECGCGGGADGEHVIEYEQASGYATEVGNTAYSAAAVQRTIVTSPGSPVRTHTFDETGQLLATVETPVHPSSLSNANQFHARAWARSAASEYEGTVTEVLSPDSVTAFSFSGWSITEKSGGSDKLTKTVRSQVTASSDVRAFHNGDSIKDRTDTSAVTVSGTTLAARTHTLGSGIGVARPEVQGRSVYPSAGGAAETTNISTEFWSGTSTDVLYIVPKKVTVTAATVVTGANGSGTATATSRYLRKDGTTAFSEDQMGRFTYTQYTNGQLSKAITDARTNHTTDFAAGDDPNTDFGITESGDGTRLVTTYTYDAQGRPDTTTAPDGNTSKNYYTKLADGRMVTISIPRMTTGGTTTYFGPCSYTVTNHAGQAEFSGTLHFTGGSTTTGLTSWIDETDSDPITAVDTGSLFAVSASVFDASGAKRTESRMYHTLPGSGAGSAGTNYDATTYLYDDAGRVIRTADPTGTISRTVYDSRGRVTETWIGTDDTGDPGSPMSGTNNMVKTSVTTYAFAAAATDQRKADLVASRTVDADGNWGTTGDQRTVSYLYDDRNRAVVTINPAAPHSVVKYDNLGRVVASAAYGSSSGLSATTDPTAATSADRVSLSETVFDARGMVWKTVRWEIDQSDGDKLDSLESLTWYDPAGRTIKSKGEGRTSKTQYDRLGRAVASFVIGDDGGETAYADMDDVAGDKVLEESRTVYNTVDGDADFGLVMMQVHISRHPGDTSTTGALDSNADGNPYKVTVSDLAGRASITAVWYDALNRQVETAHYGNNGAADFDRRPSGTWLATPTRSDSVLVTSTLYASDGTVLDVTDPRGNVTRTLRDGAGREVATIRNYTATSTPIATADRDNDLYTRYVYASGLRTQMWVDLDGDGTQDSDDQVTIFTYGTTKGASFPDSQVATGHLLFKEQHPDSSGGSDVITHAYNALSQRLWRKDQLGTELTTTYDLLGRPSATVATALGTNIDGAVRRVERAYLTRGMLDTITQYNATSGGSATDQVQYTYDGWGNATALEQDPDGAIGAGGRAAFTTQWAWTKATPTNAPAHLRRTGTTYAGLTTTYDYGTGGFEDKTGRLLKQTQSSVTLSQYTYMGAAGVALTTLPEPDVERGVGYTSGQTYGNVDNFGRITRDTWEWPGGKTWHDLAITYDRNSGITSIEDDSDDVSGAIDDNWDWKYGQDGIDRLEDADRGNLASGSISARTFRQDWALSQTGNWSTWREDSNGDSTWDATDNRTFNNANELLTRSTPSATLAHDAAGQMTDDGVNYTYVFDAWGRLKRVKNRSTTNPIIEYTYNGLGQRISERTDSDSDNDIDASDDVEWFQHDDRWRIVAVYRNSNANATERYVWHMAGVAGTGGSSYIDSMVLRDRDAAADGTYEERRYVLQNWRADVSCIIEDDGEVIEWVRYTPYGVAYSIPWVNADRNGDDGIDDLDDTDFATDFANEHPSADLNRNGEWDSRDIELWNAAFSGGIKAEWALAAQTGLRFGYAGYVHDGSVDMYHVRHRVYRQDLGRWLTRDPARMPWWGLYEYASSGPVSGRDPSGLAPLCNAGKCGTMVPPWVPDSIDPDMLPFAPSALPTPSIITPMYCILNSNSYEICADCCNHILAPDVRRSCRSACSHIFFGPRSPVTRPVRDRQIPDITHLTDEQICKLYNEGRARTSSHVLCRSGRKIICGFASVEDIPHKAVLAFFNECVIRHEEDHFDVVDCAACDTGMVCRPTYARGTYERQEECQAHVRHIDCLIANRFRCFHYPGLTWSEKISCVRQMSVYINIICNMTERVCGVRPNQCH